MGAMQYSEEQRGTKICIMGSKEELLAFCAKANFNPNWVRDKGGRFYLRLWNDYKVRQAKRVYKAITNP